MTNDEIVQEIVTNNIKTNKSCSLYNSEAGISVRISRSFHRDTCRCTGPWKIVIEFSDPITQRLVSGFEWTVADFYDFLSRKRILGMQVGPYKECIAGRNSL